MQSGHADGITYILTVNDPFAAIDLDHCRDPDTRSIETWAQLFLKWILAHPAVTCAIPATSRREHLLDNMKAGRGPLPDASARERLVALLG